jgi:hypothetical protein
LGVKTYLPTSIERGLEVLGVRTQNHFVELEFLSVDLNDAIRKGRSIEETGNVSYMQLFFSLKTSLPREVARQRLKSIFVGCHDELIERFPE